jgi:hypothetical protein
MLRIAPLLCGFARRIARSEAGVSAVEFAMVFPALLLILFGTVELGRYVMHARDLTLTVNSIGQMASQADGTLTATDAPFIRDSAMLSFPDALTEARALGKTWTEHLKIGMSGVQFTRIPNSCNPSCGYWGDVWWTSGHANVRKACGPAPDSHALIGVHADVPISTTNLPFNTYGPHEVIAVVASIDFVPLFGSTILPSLTLTRGAYFLPRTRDTISYSTSGNASFGTVCPGF